LGWGISFFLYCCILSGSGGGNDTDTLFLCRFVILWLINFILASVFGRKGKEKKRRREEKGKKVDEQAGKKKKKETKWQMIV
jgi:hypothetical protein